MSKWKIETLEDAYQERPPVRYIVTGLIEVPSVNIVYGSPSTLKSMLLLDMTLNIARGEPWLKNNEDIPCKMMMKAPVLWVDLDNGKRRTMDRIKAVGAHYGVPKEERFYYISMPVGGLNMARSESYTELGTTIESQKIKGGIVIIDNLGCVLGDTDENSHGMASIMSNFRTYAERYGIAFVIIHHQRKTNGKSKGRAGESLRGHSSIEAALDLALLVEREEDSNRINIKSTKTRGVDVRPFSAFFRFRSNESELEQAWFEGVDSNDIERRTEKLILKFLATGEKNKKQLEESCKGEDKKATPQQVGNALQRLMKSKQIGEKPGKRKEKLYFRKDGDQLELHYSHEIKPTGGG